MKTIHKSITISVEKNKVWDLLFNRFGEVNLFNPVIEGSHQTNGTPGTVGCERQCDINSKRSIHEKIVAVDGNDSFDIDIIKGGLPMLKSMYVTFKLVPINFATKVELTVNIQTKPGFMYIMMKPMMNKMFRKMLIGLKYHLETGNNVTKADMPRIEKWLKDIPKSPNRNKITVSPI